MKVTSMRKKQSRKPQSPVSRSKPKGQHERNQARPPHQNKANKRPAVGHSISCPRDAVMIWGRHAVAEALKNSKRKILKLFITQDMKDWVIEQQPDQDFDITVMDKSALSDGLRGASLDDNIVHQGIVAIARPLAQPSLDDWLDDLPDDHMNPDPMPDEKPHHEKPHHDRTHRDRPLVVLLDQITDARNIGAIMRSARAFRASAIIATDRHCPEENGAMLRTASGAMDHLPLIRVVNLARAMEKLQAHGFMLAGMTARGETPLNALSDHHRLGIIMGAEGKGLRRLTEDHADLLVRIPIDDQAESLNVSNAAAVALYAAQQQE